MARSYSPRYLHSAVLIGNQMLVFGGNTHNDTSVSYGAKCYSPDFMAYDLGKYGLFWELVWILNYCLKVYIMI